MTAQSFRNTFLGELGIDCQILKSAGIDCKILESDTLALRSGSYARTITYSDTQPIDDRPAGTLVFNSNPVAGGFVGWVSLGAGNWRDFGAIA